MIRSLTLALTLAATACGGSDLPAASPPPPAASPAPSGDFVARCTQAMTRNRDCTALYIPALVDLRVELDRPAGIAAAVAQHGRDAVIHEALGEWAHDSTDGAIDGTCHGLAGQTPPAQQRDLEAAASRCLAATDCAAYVECEKPLTRQLLSR